MQYKPCIITILPAFTYILGGQDNIIKTQFCSILLQNHNMFSCGYSVNTPSIPILVGVLDSRLIFAKNVVPRPHAMFRTWLPLPVALLASLCRLGWLRHRPISTRVEAAINCVASVAFVTAQSARRSSPSAACGCMPSWNGAPACRQTIKTNPRKNLWPPRVEHCTSPYGLAALTGWPE